MDFDGYLKTLFEMYEFEERPFTFILVDINGLHNLNRDEGYFAGDQLIKSVAKALLSTFENCNGTEVFRIGGDEFTVLIKGAPKEDIGQYLNSIENITYVYVVISREDQFASPQDLFRRTDKTLISKKKDRK